VATIHDEAKEMIRAHLTLVHVFQAYASADTPWVAHALSRCTPVRYDSIASISATHEATQFRLPSIERTLSQVDSNHSTSTDSLYN
jgi:hypothetical protein